MFPTLTLAFLLAVIATFLWFLADRRRARILTHARLTDALLRENPAAYIFWGPGDIETVSPVLAELLGLDRADCQTLRQMMNATDRQRFDDLTTALRNRGESFQFTIDLIATEGVPGGSFHITGQRSPGAALDILWIADVTKELKTSANTNFRLANAERDRDQLQAMIDNLAVPAWVIPAGSTTPAQSSQAFQNIFSAGANNPDMDAIANLTSRALASGRQQQERRHVVIEGDRRLLSITLTPVENIGFVGQAMDISQVRDLEKELDRHIAAHSDVLETLAVAIAIYGPDTKLTFYNQAYARLWDSDAKWLDSHPTLGEELEHLRARRRLPEQSDFRVWSDGEIALFTSQIGPRENLMHLPDGRTLRNRVSPHPFGGLIFTYEDVTDRLSLEAEYNTLIEVQRQSLDNLYEAIALIGGDGKLKLSNAAYKRIWNYSDDQISGEPHVTELLDNARSLIPADGDWKDQRARLVAESTTRTPHSGQISLTNNVVLQYSTVPLPDGMVLRTFIDISDRLRVEQALRERAQALEAADELKTQFIANVSYELRTPLSSVIGFTQMLKHGGVDEFSETQIDYLDSILLSSNELLNLINDILDLATLEAGYMELTPEIFEIDKLMESVHALVRQRAGSKELSLTVDYPDKLGTMRADEKRIKQVMFNLASNAINFTPPGGAVTLNADRDGDDIIFSVSDTGIGIAENQIKRVFDKFERGSDAMVRQSDTGAGLGLSLVQSFVDLHGGEVSITSEQNEGTVVTCRIPSGGPDRQNISDIGTA